MAATAAGNLSGRATMGLWDRLTQGSQERESVPGWAGFDRDWREAEFCVIDVETTGLDLKRDQVISYGAVIVREGRIIAASTHYGLVRPTIEVSEAALRVHALSGDELRRAPGVKTCAETLAQLLRGRVLVAHAAWVERAFLKRIFAQQGLRLDGPVVDTAALGRECRLVRSGADVGEPNLERLALDLDLPVHTPHHALGDALTTAEIFLAVLARIAGTGPCSVRELAEISQRQALRP